MIKYNKVSKWQLCATWVDQNPIYKITTHHIGVNPQGRSLNMQLWMRPFKQNLENTAFDHF